MFVKCQLSIVEWEFCTRYFADAGFPTLLSIALWTRPDDILEGLWKMLAMILCVDLGGNQKATKGPISTVWQQGQ